MPEMNNFDKHLMEKMKQDGSEREIRSDYADSIEKQLRTEGRLGQMITAREYSYKEKTNEKKEKYPVDGKSFTARKKVSFKRFGKIALFCYVIIMSILALIVILSIVQRKTFHNASASTSYEEQVASSVNDDDKS